MLLLSVPGIEVAPAGLEINIADCSGPSSSCRLRRRLCESAQYAPRTNANQETHERLCAANESPLRQKPMESRHSTARFACAASACRAPKFIGAHRPRAATPISNGNKLCDDDDHDHDGGGSGDNDDDDNLVNINQQQFNTCQKRRLVSESMGRSTSVRVMCDDGKSGSFATAATAPSQRHDDDGSGGGGSGSGDDEEDDSHRLGPRARRRARCTSAAESTDCHWLALEEGETEEKREREAGGGVAVEEDGRDQHQHYCASINNTLVDRNCCGGGGVGFSGSCCCCRGGGGGGGGGGGNAQDRPRERRACQAASHGDTEKTSRGHSFSSARSNKQSQRDAEKSPRRRRQNLFACSVSITTSERGEIHKNRHQGERVEGAAFTTATASTSASSLSSGACWTLAARTAPRSLASTTNTSQRCSGISIDNYDSELMQLAGDSGARELGEEQGVLGCPGPARGELSNNNSLTVRTIRSFGEEARGTASERGARSSKQRQPRHERNGSGASCSTIGCYSLQSEPAPPPPAANSSASITSSSKHLSAGHRQQQTFSSISSLSSDSGSAWSLVAPVGEHSSDAMRTILNEAAESLSFHRDAAGEATSLVSSQQSLSEDNKLAGSRPEPDDKHSAGRIAPNGLVGGARSLQNNYGASQQRAVSQEKEKKQSNCMEGQFQPTRGFPNNTLLEDLSKCHERLSTTWPRTSQATRATLRVLEATCLPSFMRPVSGRKPRSRRRWRSGELQQEQQLTTKYPSLAPASIISRELGVTDEGATMISEAPSKTTSTQTRGGNIGTSLGRHLRPKFAIPETIRTLNLSLTQDQYDEALSILTSDIRFKMHILLYRRVQTIWTMLTTIFCVLLPVLLIAHLTASLVVASSLAAWLLLQLIGALLTRNFRKKLDRMLEKAVAQANGYFMEHKLMLGVINVGGLLTKSRLCIPMVYFDTTQCREQIESIIGVDCELKRQQQLAKEVTNAGGKSGDNKTADKNNNDNVNHTKQSSEINLDNNVNLGSRRLVLDYSKFGLPKGEPTSGQSFAFAQSLARKLLLRYSQRWISYFDKRKLMFNDDKIDEPRHLSTGKCLCQFIEEHFKSSHGGAHGGAGDGDRFAHYNGQEDDDEEDDDDEFADLQAAEDCCSTDELTDMLLDGRDKHEQKFSGNVGKCVEIDIGQLVAAAAAAAATTTSDPQLPPEDAPLGVDTYATVPLGRRKSTYYNTLDSFVPTLSQLVSAKERAEAPGDSERHSGLGAPVRTDTESSVDAARVADGPECLASTVGPNNNDDLIRKLKDLLEMRKNQLSGQSTVMRHATSQWGTQTDFRNSTSSNFQNSITLLKDNNNHHQHQHLGKHQQQSPNGPPYYHQEGTNGGINLKRLLSQTTDSLSFFNTSKQKQQQQGFYVRPQQAMEIF